MYQFRLGKAAQLLGVSADTVRRWADQGRVATVRTDGGQREIEGPELARLALELGDQPLDDADSISARNRFPGLVTRVVRDTVMAQVEIQAGPHRIVSLISAEAVDALGLEPGVPAVASIKSTNVVVERAT
ncbi:MAG: TOBE domain-containing protein [Acidimicrobiales bacterium]|jgi:molybdopterin-binding protein